MSTYRVKVGNEIIEVQIQDINSHPIKASIGDLEYEIWVQEEEGPQNVRLDPLLETRQTTRAIPSTHTVHHTPDPHGIAAQPRRIEHGEKTVRAPMPGQINQVLVKPGDHVERGDLLCVLEAMKMNNRIRAPHAGTIGEAPVKPGQQVNYGDPLVIYQS